MVPTVQEIRNGDTSGALKKKKRKRKSRSTPSALHKTVGGFTVINNVDICSLRKAKRILPEWLSHPTIISTNLKEDKLKVKDMGCLDDNLKSLLIENGISYVFPVQREVIPWLLDSIACQYYKPSDLCVCAPTGSGKTLVYVLPIVQSLKNRVVPHTRAMVIVPVQELALQVYNVFLKFATPFGLKVCLAVGQRAFAKEQQELVRTNVFGTVEPNADICICTPGRLVAHLQQTKGFKLDHLRFLVIDEADRIMTDTDSDWLVHFERAAYPLGQLTTTSDSKLDPAIQGRGLPGPLTVADIQKQELPLQKLLLSATLSQDPEKLQHLHLFEPKLFTSILPPPADAQPLAGSRLESTSSAGTEEPSLPDGSSNRFSLPAGLSQRIMIIKESSLRPLMLFATIRKRKWQRVLCFTNSKEHAKRLSVLLTSMAAHVYRHENATEIGEVSPKKVEVAEFSSRLLPHQRKQVLSRFELGEINVLVCSDAVARGIDITNIDCVISYDVPKHLKTYVHRSGRTARAGHKGITLTLATEEELKKFVKIIRKIGQEKFIKKLAVSESDYGQYSEAYQKALESLQDDPS